MAADAAYEMGRKARQIGLAITHNEHPDPEWRAAWARGWRDEDARMWRAQPEPREPKRRRFRSIRPGRVACQ
jgi:hypothetical protein